MGPNVENGINKLQIPLNEKEFMVNINLMKWQRSAVEGTK